MKSDVVHFTSLGITVLDEIHFLSADPVFRVIGGSAAFCILGARLFRDPPESGALGWVIRHGKRLSIGCCICSRLQPPLWLPAYYNRATPLNASKVGDPTGAGNAFLGGFAIGYLETGNVVEASCFGTVSASFALEQIGLPVLEIPLAGQQTWNGAYARSRLAEYKRSLHSNHKINI